MIPNFIKERLKALKPRRLTPLLEKYFDLTEAIVLLGMRQTGKTCLLFLIIEKLLKREIPESNIFYFSLEDPTILTAFNKDIKELQLFIKKQDVNPNYKIYIFIDEIQYLKNPTNFLKYYYDNIPSYKFIVTGSSSFLMRQKFKDSLAGRKMIFNVFPLTFKEFLDFKGINFKTSFDLDDLEKIVEFPPDALTREGLSKNFEEYLLYGGHPRVCLLESEELKIEALKDIYNSYIRKDIKDIADIQNVDAFNSLIQVLASQVGSLVNLQELSNTLNINYLTLKRYLFLLENTFVINLVRPYFRNKRKEISKMPKVYLEDAGMRNVILSDFRKLGLRPDAGSIMENFILNEFSKVLSSLDKISFWRTLAQTEVDFVYQRSNEVIPVEVKSRPSKKGIVPSGIRSFIQNYKPKRALVITPDRFACLEFKGANIYFLPAWMV